jgi:hypothetical protein
MDTTQDVEAVTESKKRKKRVHGVLIALGLIAKGIKYLDKQVELALRAARAAITEREDDNARLVKLLRIEFGPKLEGALKNSITLSADELAFIRTFGFNV